VRFKRAVDAVDAVDVVDLPGGATNESPGGKADASVAARRTCEYAAFIAYAAIDVHVVRVSRLI